MAGEILEIIGAILLSKNSARLQITYAQYGYQILLGTGVGFFNAALIFLVSHILETRDLDTKFFDVNNFIGELF